MNHNTTVSVPLAPSLPVAQIEIFHKLLDAARRLEARGWFNQSQCADTQANHDMASMRAALANAGEALVDETTIQKSKADDRKARLAATEKTLQAHLKRGDVVTHTRCGGFIEEHIYTGRDGLAVCGKPTRDTTRIGGVTHHVNDIHPLNITHINREPLDAIPFLAEIKKGEKP